MSERFTRDYTPSWSDDVVPPLPDLPRFPAGFGWGAATAAFQIEGSPTADGKGASIWDEFVARPGAIRDGSTADVACDSYRRFREDTDLLAWLGMRDYRFSIAWPRIQPDGVGPALAAGLDHYDAVVDDLLAAGVRPVPTLYHWDLPLALQQRGGWTNPEIVERFAEYTGLVVQRLADRVPTWITINEPVMTTLQGYGTGELAPGLQLMQNAVPTAHLQLLAHATAAQVIKSIRSDARVGVSNNHALVVAASDDEADVIAADTFDRLYNRVFSDPLLLGEYPDLGPLGGRPDVPAEHLAAIAGSCDFYGLNFYNAIRIGAADPRHTGLPFEMLDFADVPVTGFGWPIRPDDFREVLVDMHRRYGRALPPITITENGCSFPDGQGDSKLVDLDRVNYLHGHLTAVAAAIEQGVNVTGYYVWSLLDNFEWADGYTQRFGLTHVDFDNGTRTPRLSAHWLRDQLTAQR
ncbi:beta-glucosidase [Stackebrandtia endophytica]|uniref:Beta-glucosidase n=1 Tax=Stackebrandtia endophytica TaxID=1496996 RepID=A0A543AUQ5_9ACTN|nr:GH1 family beta-glucosidase [Stackebrandtia endophytica]TQL76271.1 beta-glucosidase [Stackebrandtia endophytica]